MTLHRFTDSDDNRTPHRMRAKRDGEYAECETELYEGEEIVWDPKEYKAYCIPCGEELLNGS